jgi:hypothetical protein
MTGRHKLGASRAGERKGEGWLRLQLGAVPSTVHEVPKRHTWSTVRTEEGVGEAEGMMVPTRYRKKSKDAMYR